MSIYLDQTKIPGYQQKIAVTLSLAGEDLSGQSSNTVQAETGDKPKALSISTNIKYENANDLSILVSLAEARNDKDDRVIYNIINPTAKAMKIRRVKFQGDVSVKEQTDLKAWSISFKLIEYESVAEKKQQRVLAKPVKEQAAIDHPIVNTNGSTAVNDQLSYFETHVLNKIDNILS